MPCRSGWFAQRYKKRALTQYLRTERCEWYRCESQQKEDETRPPEPAPRARQGPVRVQHRRMAQTPAGEDEQQRPPDEPTDPEPTHEHDDDPESPSQSFVVLGRRGVEDVTAVELRDRQEIERRDEHAEPTGHGDGVQHDAGGMTHREESYDARDDRVAQVPERLVAG